MGERARTRAADPTPLADERAPAEPRRPSKSKPSQSGVRPAPHGPDPYFAVAYCYGFTCAVGAIEPIAGIVLVAMVCGIAALRALVKTRWLVAVLVLMMVAELRFPWVATLIGAATILTLLVRVVFVMAHLRAVVVGALAYAALVAGVIGAARVADRLTHIPQLPLDHEVARWLGAGGVGIAAGGLMAVAMYFLRRGGYSAARSLEVMALLPLLVIGSIVPFLDHEALFAAWKLGRLPVATAAFRMPPGILDALAAVHRLVGS